MPFSKLEPDDPTLGVVPEAQQQFIQDQLDLVDPTRWFFPNAAFPIQEEPESVFTEDMLVAAKRESATPPVFGGFDSFEDAGLGDTFDAFGDDLFNPAGGFGGGFEDGISPPLGSPVVAPRPLPAWQPPASPPRAVIMGDDGQLIEVFAPSPGVPVQPPPTYVSPYERVPVTSSFSIKDCGCGCGQCGK